MTGEAPPEVVIGAGHNGLVAACYLALAGRDVLVLEALESAGGGSRTAETIPGYRFDLHSAAHNIINMTDIPDQLDLAGAGLRYVEMDPFATSIRPDGHHVRFWRSIDATVASIARHDRAEAGSYRSFMDLAVPLVRALLPAIRADGSASGLARAGWHLVGALRQGRRSLLRDLLGPYDAMLARRLGSDLTRAPVGAFAAHGAVGPTTPGGAIYGFWQAAYHLFGQWHAAGGSQALVDALTARLERLGGQVRTSAPVTRIETLAGRVAGVRLADGQRIRTDRVIAAIDPTITVFELLDVDLAAGLAADLRAVRRSNVVQGVVHVASRSLPPYPGARPEDFRGLQSYVDTMATLRDGWAAAEAGRLPSPLPLYAFTPSAIDAGLAPPGHHTLYLACPTTPAQIIGGWAVHCSEFVEATLATLEAHAPGFESTVVSSHAWTPDRMDAEGTWPGAHPMHLDLALHQLGVFRPTPALAAHRTPIVGLYLSGAGTAPTGGIAGTPGRQAARALLADAATNTR
ncbi:MAG: phytoene desaturase family protein [Acidimicrobiales bacterium]